MDTIVKIDNISGGYNKGDIVLRDVSFTIQQGDFTGIIGPNGSGKSTLLRFMSRILAPEKGNIYLGQKNISGFGLKELCRRIAFVPQDTTINFSFSVWEIVLMGRIPHLKRMQLETKADFLIAEKALSATDTLHLKNRSIENLSAGERQRVVIAKALAQEPDILLLDEPTSHLDIGHQIQILELLKKLNKENNLTIIMVMHDLNLASEYCGNIILLNQGKIFKEGKPADILTYKNIEEVYKTVVVVGKNPVSSNPYIFAVTGANRCARS